jgi:hypothetical protein
VAEVDVRDVVVAEYADPVAQAQVDARRLDGVIRQRLDSNAASGDFFAHRPIAQDHGAPRRPRAGVRPTR